MCQNSRKTKAGMSIGPGEVDLHLRRAVATSKRLIFGEVEGVVLKVGGAGLSVTSVRQLRWASALFNESPSNVEFKIVFLTCFL